MISMDEIFNCLKILTWYSENFLSPIFSPIYPGPVSPSRSINQCVCVHVRVRVRLEGFVRTYV